MIAWCSLPPFCSSTGMAIRAGCVVHDPVHGLTLITFTQQIDKTHSPWLPDSNRLLDYLSSNHTHSCRECMPGGNCGLLPNSISHYHASEQREQRSLAPLPTQDQVQQPHKREYAQIRTRAHVVRSRTYIRLHACVSAQGRKRWGS